MASDKYPDEQNEFVRQQQKDQRKGFNHHFNTIKLHALSINYNHSPEATHVAH